MKLKTIKTKYGKEVAVNPDHVTRVEHSGENDAEVFWPDGNSFVTTLTFEQTLKLLQEE